MTKQLEAFIFSEITDFFAGFDSPGEPRTPQEMQQQLLTRVITIVSELEQSQGQLSKAYRQASAARNAFDEQYRLREVAEKRIAELEASQLAVKLRRHDAGEVMHTQNTEVIMNKFRLQTLDRDGVRYRCKESNIAGDLQFTLCGDNRLIELCYRGVRARGKSRKECLDNLIIQLKAHICVIENAVLDDTPIGYR